MKQLYDFTAISIFPRMTTYTFQVQNQLVTAGQPASLEER